MDQFIGEVGRVACETPALVAVPLCFLSSGWAVGFSTGGERDDLRVEFLAQGGTWQGEVVLCCYPPLLLLWPCEHASCF